MGTSGGTAAQYRIDCPGSSGEFSQGIGWEEFTDAAIHVLAQQERPIVFILWGKPAQAKESMITNPLHLVLKSPHPSPLSAYRGFFGSRVFSRTNTYLESHGLEPIDWQIENRQ